MKACLLSLTAAILSVPLATYAQDTVCSLPRNGIDLDFNLAGGWYKQNPTADDQAGEQHVYVPEGLPRRQNDATTRSDWQLNDDHMTDNPLRHGCLYIDFAMRGRIGKDLTLYADLVGEHRGFSGGLYNTANLVVYPKMSAVYERSFPLVGQVFTIGAIGGYRDSLRQMEGLTVYNVDVDNATIYAQWRRLRLSVSQIGDMLYTGLGVDDQVSGSVSLEGLQMRNGWKADIRLASIINTGFRLSLHEDFSAAVYLPGSWRLYAQGSQRESISNGNRYAGLAGLRYGRQGKRISLNGFFEARYYGAAYNRGYIYEEVYFRPRRALKTATDYVGPYLYPLMNMERPYSKWAVYTEYQNRDVAALNLYADLRCKLFDHFFAKLSLDVNYISPSGLKAYCLPFYGAGIGYEVLDDNIFVVALTNKAMNLDKHYQDFYLQQEPSVQFQFVRTFGWE